jgi:hypothetical protein
VRPLWEVFCLAATKALLITAPFLALPLLSTEY